MDNQQIPPNPQITMNTGTVPPPVAPQQAPIQAQPAQVPPYGYGQMPVQPYPYAASPYQCPSVAQPVQQAQAQPAFLPPAPPPAPAYPHPHYSHHHGYGYPVYDPNNAAGYPAHLYACYPQQTAPQAATQASPQYPYPQAYYPYGYPVPYAQPTAPATGEHNQTFASFFNFRDERFLKGAITGAALTFLLTNESLQKNTIKSLVKVWNTLQGGLEEVKERFQDAEAELKAESQK